MNELKAAMDQVEEWLKSQNSIKNWGRENGPTPPTGSILGLLAFCKGVYLAQTADSTTKKRDECVFPNNFFTS